MTIKKARGPLEVKVPFVLFFLNTPTNKTAFCGGPLDGSWELDLVGAGTVGTGPDRASRCIFELKIIIIC
jgi:hypothetical protein